MKLNFFSRIYLAITDFRLYRFVVQKEKWRTAYAYFVCFMILIAITLATNIAVKTLKWMGELIEAYEHTIEEFTISDGEMTIVENMNTEIAGVKILTNDELLLENVEGSQIHFDGCQFAILAVKDGVMIGKRNFGFWRVPYEEVPMALDRATLYSMVLSAYASIPFRISLVGFLFCMILVVYLLAKGIHICVLSFLMLILGNLFKIQYRYSDYMKAAFYVVTLPIITEVIAFLVVGELNEYASVTYHLLCYVYCFYAIRALKLDNILVVTQEKLMNLQKENGQQTEETPKEEVTEEKQEQEEEQKEEKKSERNESEDGNETRRD